MRGSQKMKLSTSRRSTSSSSVSKKRALLEARHQVTAALNHLRMGPNDEITRAYLREAMVLAFVAGADWAREQGTVYVELGAYGDLER